MKNIHVLPTEKPSRLFNCFGKLEIGDYTTIRENLQVTNQHIYITSDEEIKEGDWLFDLDIKRIVKADNLKVLTSQAIGCWYYKKIILTTDQDLIEDGVQAIDDEFLEWFVKNSSCEQVEVHELRFFNPDTNESEHCKWELYIPKEEPKQETLSLKVSEETVYYQVLIVNNKGEKLAFKQNDKWTINASTEEILDQILDQIFKTI